MTRLGKQPPTDQVTKGRQRQQPAYGSARRFTTVLAKPKGTSKRGDTKTSKRLTCPKHVYECALSLFTGHHEATREWLRRPAPDLHWKTPLEAAQTEEGAQDVINLVIRIADGVLS
jgi:putative toxin-antitoxin system antitoxin component (TIGR02293 family)